MNDHTGVVNTAVGGGGRTGLVDKVTKLTNQHVVLLIDFKVLKSKRMYNFSSTLDKSVILSLIHSYRMFWTFQPAAVVLLYNLKFLPCMHVVSSVVVVHTKITRSRGPGIIVGIKCCKTLIL